MPYIAKILFFVLFIKGASSNTSAHVIIYVINLFVTVAALGFSIDGLKTINCSNNFFFKTYAIFLLLQPKKLMGLTNLSLEIMVFTLS